MNNLVGRSIHVSGKVQGVFFRASTAEEANKLGLSGWVKNLTSGDVYIEVFGTSQQVELLIAWCKKGPPLASVAQVVVETIAFREETPFRIAY